MPDDTARPIPVQPHFEALLLACAMRATPAERRSAIAGAVDAFEAALDDWTRSTRLPVQGCWREMLDLLRREMRRDHQTEMMQGLSQAQALVLARAFPKIGPGAHEPGSATPSR